MAQIDIDKFVISLRRCFGENKGIATTLDRCLLSLGLKYVDTPTGGRLERVDQPTMLERLCGNLVSGEQKGTLCDTCRKAQPSHSCQDITALGRCALEKQGELKPVGWSKEDERDFDVIYGIIYNSCNAEDASRLIAWLKAIKYRVIPQPNQEWSEEDEKIYQSIMDDTVQENQLDDKQTEWLRNIKYRKLPQPKQEWNEEDESHIRYLIECLEHCKKGVALTMTTSTAQEYINWLKSLRPQNWTKEDKERYISCLQRLSTGNPEQPETINSKWFKEHMYPQKQWKPTKEQTMALKWALNYIPYNCHKEEIKGLLKQIEDL